MADFIDLDNLGEAAGTPAPKQEANPGQLVHTPQTSSSIEDLYDRYTKHIYVLDNSGSMNHEMLGADDFENWNFTAKHFAEIQKRIDNAKIRAAAGWIPGTESAGECGLFEVEEDEETESPDSAISRDDLEKLEGIVEIGNISDDPDSDEFWLSLDELTQEERKQSIILEGRTQEMYSMYRKTNSQDFTKLEIMKKAAKRMIQERVDKYPDANLGVVRFGGNASAIPSTTLDGLLHAVDSLTGHEGDTNIPNAIKAALKLCKKSPSLVNSHHIILVTDGMDHRGDQVESMVPEMREKGIVLDFIHVDSNIDRRYADSNAVALQRACVATGGVFTHVNKVKDFETKFFEAARRLCLPAPSGN